MTAEVKPLPDPDPDLQVADEDDFDELESIREYLDEVDQHVWRFKVGGEVYEANLNLEGVYMLRWVTAGIQGRLQMIPDLLKAVLGDEQYMRLMSSGIPWVKMDAVSQRIIEKVQGPLPGKARPTRSRSSSRGGASSRGSGKRSKRTS